MSESKKPRDYSPYQQKIIQRYYGAQDTIQMQRLSELVGELYLTEGKKKEKTWKAVEDTMRRLKINETRIEHLMKQANPNLIAELVKELEAKK